MGNSAIVCPYCKSEEIISRGGYTLKTGEKKRSYECKGCHKHFSEFDDVEIIGENVRLKKARQKSDDSNRIERKAFREHARIENAIEELGKSIKAELHAHGRGLRKLNLKPLAKSKSKAVGVYHITDPHGNELISLPHNKYDFTVFSQRLKLYSNDSLDFFEHMGVSRVLVALTGDLLNSDRRIDELLNSATNRAKACILTAHLLKQAILEIRGRGFEVDVISVLGNEARIGKELPYSQQALSENYDFTIAAILKEIFTAAKIKGINFGSIDKVEEIANVNGQNWLIAHDISQYTSKQEKSQSAIGRFSLQGHTVDYIIGGHIHSTRITDITSRPSSFSGSNSYNENALNFAGRAGGVCYVVKDGRRHVYQIDVQNVDGIEGYEIVKELEAYHAKSAEKLTPHRVIYQVVV
jgi:transposase-like protein/putative heme iron utilization protein